MSEQKPHTAAWRLFKLKYRMRIPQAFMYGEAYIEKHGYAVSGDHELDHARMMELSVMSQSVAALAMFHADGAAVDLVDERDAVPIYADIREHLTDWERETRTVIHLDSIPPLEEFRQLEAVAIELHAAALHHEPIAADDGIQARLMAMNRRRNPRRTESSLRQRNYDKRGNLKPYESIVDKIEQNMIEATRWQ